MMKRLHRQYMQKKDGHTGCNFLWTTICVATTLIQMICQINDLSKQKQIDKMTDDNFGCAFTLSCCNDQRHFVSQAIYYDFQLFFYYLFIY
jgi:hypothetical protein